MHLNIRPKFLLLAIIAALVMACTDEVFTSDPSKKLSFSTDTLTFDTVFTTMGTTTQKLMVYNRNNRALRINRIGLAAGQNSSFRLNVDGMRNDENEFFDVEIAAKDSMFIFVEATVNPTEDNSPFLVLDSLVCELNGNKQHVLLEAFGQNFNLLKNTHITSYSTLLPDKPYLVMGNLTVDSAVTLSIAAGCKIYFHNNANLVVYGNLASLGTFTSPVEMRGSRLDEVRFTTPVPYNYVAGQWGGVYLLSDKGSHLFRNTIITSAYVGLYSPNENRFSLPEIQVENCRIHNFVYYGIVAQNTNLTVLNSEISNTGSYTVFLSGGHHVFHQSTIANHYANNSYAPTSRDKTPAVFIMEMQRIASMTTEFVNCLVSGSIDNELAIASKYMSDYDGVFSYTYIKRKNPYSLSQFQNIRWYKAGDELFVQSVFNSDSKNYFSFVPDSLSPARNMAEPAMASRYPTDLNGNNRFADGNPDVGCYEWISKY